MSYILSVKEQKPLISSIFCEVQVTKENGRVSLHYGYMYFVCDLKKKVTQHPLWLLEYKDQLKTLGYKL